MRGHEWQEMKKASGFPEFYSQPKVYKAAELQIYDVFYLKEIIEMRILDPTGWY